MKIYRILAILLLTSCSSHVTRFDPVPPKPISRADEFCKAAGKACFTDVSSARRKHRRAVQIPRKPDIPLAAPLLPVEIADLPLVESGDFNEIDAEALDIHSQDDLNDIDRAAPPVKYLHEESVVAFGLPGISLLLAAGLGLLVWSTSAPVPKR